MLGLRGAPRKEASSSWQIACRLGSHCPYIAFPLSPYLLNWFSLPAYQGVMKSLGVRMNGGAAPTDSHSFLSRNPKILVMTTDHTGEMNPGSGMSLSSLLESYNFSLSLSYFHPIISYIVYNSITCSLSQSIFYFLFSTADWCCLLPPLFRNLTHFGRHGLYLSQWKLWRLLTQILYHKYKYYM